MAPPLPAHLDLVVSTRTTPALSAVAHAKRRLGYQLDRLETWASPTAGRALESAGASSLTRADGKAVVAASIEGARLVCLRGLRGPLSCNTRNSCACAWGQSVSGNHARIFCNPHPRVHWGFVESRLHCLAIAKVELHLTRDASRRRSGRSREARPSEGTSWPWRRGGALPMAPDAPSAPRLGGRFSGAGRRHPGRRSGPRAARQSLC